MDTILRHQGTNIGGINSIFWIFSEDVQAFNMSWDTGYCSIGFVSGKNWNSLYGTPESMVLESDCLPMPGGMKFTYKIKVLVPKDRSDVEMILVKMTLRNLLVLAVDKNNTARVFGTKDNPMKMTYKLLKPALLEGFTGYEILFSGDFSSPCAFYTIPSGSGISST